MRTVLVASRGSKVSSKFRVNIKTNIFIPIELLELVDKKYEKQLQMFFNRLFREHPSLTKNDKIICGLIKLGYDTNQISIKTNKSKNSIEVARTRLRNKISITNKLVSLSEYLDYI